MEEKEKGFLVFTEVERVERLTAEEFQRSYDKPKKPVVITGAMTHWKAMSEWSHEWFRDRHGSLTVSLSRNPRHTFYEKEMLLRDYVDSILTGRDDGMYMDQCPIENVPGLGDYVERPPYCPPGRDLMVNLWVGPAGTILGFHKDSHNPFDLVNNIFTQLVGRKRVVLAAPDQDAFMYQRPREAGDYWHSQIDLDHPDFERFPLFRQAKLYETVVGPGEMLFIPADYWHYVRSLEKSISVSFWWRAYRVVEIFNQLFTAYKAERLEAYASANRGTVKMEDVYEFGGAERLSATLKSVPMPAGFREVIHALMDPQVRASVEM